MSPFNCRACHLLAALPKALPQAGWQEASSLNQPMQHRQCNLHHKSVLFALNCSWTDSLHGIPCTITTRNSGRDHTTTHLEATTADMVHCCYSHRNSKLLEAPLSAHGVQRSLQPTCNSVWSFSAQSGQGRTKQVMLFHTKSRPMQITGGKGLPSLRMLPRSSPQQQHMCRRQRQESIKGINIDPTRLHGVAAAQEHNYQDETHKEEAPHNALSKFCLCTRRRRADT